MSFKNAINNFHLELNKLNSNPEYSSFSFDLPGLQIMYQSVIRIVNEFEASYSSSNIKLVELLKEYDKSIIKNNDIFFHDKENYEAIYHFNSDNISSDLKNKINELESLNSSINDEEYLSTIKNRDVLNNIDINKNLSILGFQGYEPDIHKNYNKMMVLVNKKCETDNNQNHAKTSKDIYILSEANNKKTDDITEQIVNTKKSIDVLNNEISSRKKRKDDAILDEDKKFNLLIDKLTKKYNSEKNLNNIQSNIEIDSLNESLDQISEKYNALRQKISTDLQEKFEIIDKQIDEEVIKYSNELNEFYSSYALKKYKLEKKYNDTIYLNNELERHSIITKKMQKYQEKTAKKSFFQFDKIMKKKENNIKNAYLIKINNLKNNKYFLDNNRKYNLSLLEIDEKIEKHQVLNNIQYSKLEKKEYEKIIENNLSIEANKNRVTSLNLKHNFGIEFTRFELSLKSSIYQLERKLADLISHKDYLTNYLDETIESKQKIDNNKKRLNDLCAILSIEKYKSLVKYNLGLIESQTNKCMINHDFEVKTAQNIYLKEKKALDLKKDLNTFYLDFYKLDANLSKQKETIEYQFNLAKLTENLNYNSEAIKLDLKINKLKIDYKLFEDLFKVLENVSRVYSIYLTNNLKNISSKFNNDNKITAYIGDLLLIFKNLYDNLNKYANKLAKKLINDRIYFSIGNSYNDLIEQVNKEYEEKDALINTNLSSLNETISKYKTTIHNYYKQIDILKTKLDSVKNDLSWQNIRIIKKDIKDKENKINKINASIKNLEEQISNIPIKKQMNLEYKEKSISKINNLKNNDLNPYFQIITLIDNVLDKSSQELNRIDNIGEYLNTNSSKLSLLLTKICTYINSSFNTTFKAYKRICSSLYNVEFNILENSNNELNQRHNTNISTITKNYEKNKKIIDKKIEVNDKLYLDKQMDNNYQISILEKNYMAAYSLNNKLKKNKELELIQHQNDQKKKYFAIFDACNANSYSIRNSMIKEIKKINKDYNASIIELNNKKIQEIKDHEKDFKQKGLKRKKNMALLQKYDKAEKKNISNEYKLKNIVLENEIKSILEGLKVEKKKSIDENENYKKIQLKEKVKLTRQYNQANNLLNKKVKQ